jgi:tRNA(Ile)-lysidine synthase
MGDVYCHDEKQDAESLYRRALSRLSPEERKRERSRRIPYPLSMSALSRLFFETGNRQGWLVTGSRRSVVLAVSGGGDSMALLWLFRIFYEGKIVVAHLEHGIRGEESLSDARFVEETSHEWGIETEIRRVDVPNLLKKGESLETGARRLRCAFLESTAEKVDAFGVALGHNREDVAETVLHNLLRGSGIRGVIGIPERRGIFFRPLLRCSRDFLRSILRCRGVSWREDRTNAENTCTRNFIRNELFPAAENRINKKVVDHLVAFSEEMRYYREEEERCGAALAEVTRELSPKDGRNGEWNVEGWHVDREKAQALSLWERAILVREIGRRLAISTLSRERCGILARLMEGKKRFEFQWGEGISVWGSRDRIRWTAKRPNERGLKAE